MEKYSEKDDKKISGGMKAYNSSETTSNQQISKYNTGANGNTGHGFAAEDVRRPTVSRALLSSGWNNTTKRIATI